MNIRSILHRLLKFSILFLCCLQVLVCSKINSSDSEPEPAGNAVVMGSGYSEIHLPKNATEVTYGGNFAEDQDYSFFDIAVDSLRWSAKEVTDNDGAFQIRIDLKPLPDPLPISRDTFFVKISSGNLTMVRDTVVIIRSAPQAKGKFGDSIPVLFQDGQYTVDLSIVHPAGLPIVKIWVAGSKDSSACSLGNTNLDPSCDLSLTTQQETVSIIVEDSVGARDTASIFAYFSESTIKMIASFDSINDLAFGTNQYDLQLKVFSLLDLTGYKLKSGNKIWLLDSMMDKEHQVTLEVPLAPITVTTIYSRIDTLKVSLLGTTGQTVTTIRWVVMRSRPQFQLDQKDSITLQYPDTVLTISGVIVSRTPIDSVWAQGELQLVRLASSSLKLPLALPDTTKRLVLKAKSSLGSVSEKTLQIQVKGKYEDDDKDSVRNWEEIVLGFRMDSKDSDGDGKLDRYEDRDGDGLSDLFELRQGTDIRSRDTDQDGLDDFQETQWGTNPHVVDSDGDGSLDGLEVQEGNDPMNRLQGGDQDKDGLSDQTEAKLGSSPTKADTDGDGLSDFQEYQLGTSLIQKDTDNDGVDDKAELAAGLSPINKDSDGDGISDGAEIQAGTNPKTSNNPRLPILMKKLLPGLDTCVLNTSVGDLWLAHMSDYDMKDVYSAIRGEGITEDRILSVMMAVNVHNAIWKVGKDTNTIVVGGYDPNFEYVETVIGDGVLNIATAFKLDGKLNFSDIHPNLDFLSFLDLRGALIMTPSTVSTGAFEQIQVPGLARNLGKGLTLLSPIDISGMGIDEVLQAKTLFIEAAFPLPKNMANFKLYASLDYDVQIAGDLMFKEAGVQIRRVPKDSVNALPKGVNIALVGKLQLQMSAEDSLIFAAALKWRSQMECGMYAMMTGAWQEPFGMPGVVLDSIAVDYTRNKILGTTLGLAGVLKIGSVYAKAAIMQNARFPLDKMIEAEFRHLNLFDILNATTLPLQPWLKSYVDLSLDTVRYYQAKKEVSIGTIVYPAGIQLYGAMQILGLKGHAGVQVKTLAGKKVDLSALYETDPVIILPGVAELRGRNTENGGPLVNARISPTTQKVSIDAYATLLGITADATMVADLNGINMDVSGKIFNAFNANVNLNSTFGKKIAESPFNVSAAFQQDFLNFIDNQASNAINAATNATQSTLAPLRANVIQAQEVVAAQKKIFDDAQSTLDDAQAEVDRLDGLISQKKTSLIEKTNSYNTLSGCVPSGQYCAKWSCDFDCPACWEVLGECTNPAYWTCKGVEATCDGSKQLYNASCSVYKFLNDCSSELAQAAILSGEIAALSAEIPVLEASRVTAWAALEAAKLALEAPKLALDAAKLSLQGYEATLTGAILAAGALGTAANFIMANGLGALLVVKEAGFESTLAEAQDKQVTVWFKVSYQGASKQFKVNFDFKNTDAAIKAIADYLIDKTVSSVNPF